MAAPDLMIMPFLSILEVSIVCTIGMAKARAQGQVIIRTAIVLAKAI